jgi:hypothetical protein
MIIAVTSGQRCLHFEDGGGQLTKNPRGKYKVFILYKLEDFSEL